MRPTVRKWEQVAQLLERTPCPGGWIYRTTDDSTQSVALTFVPAASDVERGLITALRALYDAPRVREQLAPSESIRAQVEEALWHD
jgi:hypothetical protein